MGVQTLQASVPGPGSASSGLWGHRQPHTVLTREARRSHSPALRIRETEARVGRSSPTPPSTDGGAHGGPWGGLVHSNGPCSLGAWSADLRMMPAGGSHAPAPATPQLTPALGPRKLPEGLHWHPIQSLRVGGEATRTLDKDPGQQGTRPQSRGRGRQTETLPCPVPAGEAAEQELGGQSPRSGCGGDGCQPRESETHREAGGAPSTSCFEDSCCRTEGQVGRGESELRIPPACTPLFACPGPWMDKGLAGPPAARPAGSV